MAEGCVLGLMVYQWLKIRHQAMLCKMLNQLLRNLALKYQMLELNEAIKLV